MKILSRHVIVIKSWNKADKFVVDFLPRIIPRYSDHAPFNLTFRELSVASELDLRNLNGYRQEILSWRFSSRFDTLLPCRIVKYIRYRAQFAIRRWNVENGKGKISITVFRGPKISLRSSRRKDLRDGNILNGWNEAWTNIFAKQNFHRNLL